MRVARLRAVRVSAYLILFLLVGEVLLRVDQAARLFQGERHLIVNRNLRETPELAAVRAGSLPMRPGDLRVLVLGDSYIQGGGIAPDATFASRLAALLRADPGLAGHEVYVLDASAGGANTATNHRHYFELVDRFRPHVVFLAYNNNDVYAWGQEEPAPPAGTQAPPGETAPAARAKPREPWIRVLRRTLFESEALQFVLQQTNMQLKLHGIVVPGTEFHHLVREAYRSTSEGWKGSQVALEEMAADAAGRGSTFVVYNMPEFNMLGNYGAFAAVDRELASFFASQPVVYLRGADRFRAASGGDFALSRYDGHPNAAAHAAIARDVYQAISDRMPRARE